MEAVPGAARIAVLATGGPVSDSLREAQKAASALRVKLVTVEVQGADYDRAFASRPPVVHRTISARGHHPRSLPHSVLAARGLSA